MLTTDPVRHPRQGGSGRGGRRGGLRSAPDAGSGADWSGSRIPRRSEPRRVRAPSPIKVLAAMSGEPRPKLPPARKAKVGVADSATGDGLVPHS
jgi:hypothetical protein